MTQTQSARYIPLGDTAKLVRTSLKENFPGIKFSVTCKYSSIRIKWVDGPTETAVQEVTRRYKGASFDSSIDLKSYHDSELNGEPVHFGADCVFVNRSTSQEFVTAVAQAYCDRYNHPMPMIALIGDGSAYIADRDYSNYHDYRNDIWRKINETDASQVDKMFEEEDRQLAEYDARVAARKAEEEQASKLVVVNECEAIVQTANDLYGETEYTTFYIYASVYRPMSASWAHIPGARFVNAPKETGAHTWIVVSSKLDKVTIDSYELTPEPVYIVGEVQEAQVQEKETPVLYCADCAYELDHDDRHVSMISDDTIHYCQQCGEKRIKDSLHQIDSTELYSSTYKELGIDITPVVGYSNWVDTICCSCVKECGIDTQDWIILTDAQSKEDDGYWCDYCATMF